MKIYLETSTINFVLADDVPDKRDATKNFFENVAIKHDIYISQLVITEIDKAPKEKKEKLNSLIAEHKPKLLEVTKEAEDLANIYVKEGIIPEKYSDDALHIAIAVVNNMDAVISWNMEHIVKLKTMVKVSEINKRLKYKEIFICTPEEVVE